MHLTESTTTHSFCLFVISHVIKKLLLSAFDKLLQNDRTVFMGSCCVLFFGYCKKKEIWMKVIQHNNNNNSFAQLVGRKNNNKLLFSQISLSRVHFLLNKQGIYMNEVNYLSINSDRLAEEVRILFWWMTANCPQEIDDRS